MHLLGIGYDVHRLVRGRKLILGGVNIPHDTGLDGHSDADALCHAIADAALGAIGERDIGYHFPNYDEAIRGISSIEILKRVALILAQQHSRVLNVDSTIIAEAPKMAPHITAMRENIAAALGLPVRRVGVKATTNETLGFAGRGEGIAAIAITNVEQNDPPISHREMLALISMALRFFNTYSREIEEFIPIEPPLVRMYTCGPTVYNYAHIGNFRAYIFEDLLQRHLEARGFQVHRVMNLTDVDDKTIRNSRAAGEPLDQFTRKFKDAFFEDLRTLRIQPAADFPAATEPRFIEKMIEMIQELVNHGIAYQADDRSVYFRLSRFPEYGKLAHLNLDELRPTGRISNDEYEKESIGDFALWKAWDEADGDVGWDSPWGRGRPGWHIECSAMATELLGPEIDIHCGGVDNIFPHHEAEIAQSESCTGKKFVRYWLHCAHLMVQGQKMAKSAGNFYTLRDLIAQGWTGREIRFALISVNYRLPLNFTFEGMTAARSALARIDEWVTRLTTLAGSENRASMHPLAEPTKFQEALDDDLNISGALGHLFDAIRESNRLMDQQQFAADDARAMLNAWNKINHILAFDADATAMPSENQSLLNARDAARKRKDWAESDRLRDQLAALGWEVKDTKDGQRVVRRPT